VAVALAVPYANHLYFAPDSCSSLMFYGPGPNALPAVQPTVSKHWRW